MKDTSGYEQLYSVTEDGCVWSKPKQWKTGRHNGKWMKQSIHPLGYMYVGLRKNNKQKHIEVHRLVAAAFIPNPNKLPEVNHKNGIKTDNKVSNLEWVTTSKNHEHAIKVLGIKFSPKDKETGRFTSIPTSQRRQP